MNYKQDELEVCFTDLLKRTNIHTYCLESRLHGCRAQSIEAFDFYIVVVSEEVK